MQGITCAPATLGLLGRPPHIHKNLVYLLDSTGHHVYSFHLQQEYRWNMVLKQRDTCTEQETVNRRAA